MRIAALLRALVLALLGGALFIPGLWRDAAGAMRPLRVTDGAGADEIGRSAAAPIAPPLIVRETLRPPDAAELDALAAAGERTPVLAAGPSDAPLVTLEPPASPRAGRAAAIPFRVRAKPREEVWVRLADEAGALDSVRLRMDDRGSASGAFRVRPARAGWREWSIEAQGRRASAGAWVDTAAAPRVLIRAGLPGWEARFLVRVLEESGARVDVRFDLGRGMAVGQGSGDAITPERLAASDAVLVLDGAPLVGAEASALARYAARGSGVLVAGDRVGVLGLVRGTPVAAPVDGSSIRWSAPAELAVLPADRIRLAAVPFAAPPAPALLAASSAQGGILALRPLGRGRAAALALTDTWRWRMEGGRVEEHREFWRGVVDWLASAPRDALVLRPATTIGAPGVRQEVSVFAADGATPPPALLLVRPGAVADTLPLIADPLRPGVFTASFVPAGEGVYTLGVPGSSARTGFRAVRSGSVDAVWARLGMIAHASGGEIVPRSELDRAVAARTAGDSAPPLPFGWLLLAALVLAAGAEWTIRRLSGHP